MASKYTGIARYARELGATARAVRTMGGVEKLKKLTPEVRHVLLFPKKVAAQKSNSRFRWPVT